MDKTFRRNGKSILKVEANHNRRASYCITFETDTKTVKVLKVTKISQSSEQIMIDFSEWRDHESKRLREFRKEVALSETPSRKKYGFSYDLIQIKFC